MLAAQKATNLLWKLKSGYSFDDQKFLKEIYPLKSYYV